MSLFEVIIEGFVQEILMEILGFFPGSIIRWFFLRNKYSFQQCIKTGKGWNILISIIFWVLLIFLLSR